MKCIKKLIIKCLPKCYFTRIDDVKTSNKKQKSVLYGHWFTGRHLNNHLQYFLLLSITIK